MLGAWSYFIQCGVCKREVSLRKDAQTPGRVQFFKKHHYNKCAIPKSKRTQKTLEEVMSAKKRKDDLVTYDDDEVVCTSLSTCPMQEDEPERDFDLGDDDAGVGHYDPDLGDM